MTGEFFFNRPRMLRNRIRRKRAQLEALKSSLLPSGIRYDLDKIQTTPEDHFSEVMAEVASLEREIGELKRKLRASLLELGDALEKLDDETEKTVLVEFYIGGITLSEISTHIGYSLRQTKRIKQHGLQKMSQMSVR